MAAVCLISGASLVGATGPGNSGRPTWGAAEKIPGLALLAVGETDVSSISCPSPGNCALGGVYASTADPSYPNAEGFVADETDGIWGSAEEIPGLGAINVDHYGKVVTSVSCATPGNCAAVGNYSTASAQEGFVVSESNGTWGDAQEVPGLAVATAGGGSSSVDSVSCPTAGNCVAVGSYRTAGGVNGTTYAYVVEESDGTWGSAIAVPGLSGSNLDSVSCVALGECVAGGSGVQSGAEHAFILDESNGTWGAAQAVPGLSVLGPAYGVAFVSCGAVGDCAVAGGFVGHIGPNDNQDFVDVESDGIWGSAQPIPGLAKLNAGLDALVTGLSCGAQGSCAVGGTYLSNAHNIFGAFVDSSSGGVWGDARSIPGLDALDPGRNSGVSSVSCGAAGNCSAVGYYAETGLGYGFVVNETGGKWHNAEAIAGFSRTVSSSMGTISCPSASRCTAAGNFNVGSSFVAWLPGRPPYCSPANGLSVAVQSPQLSDGDAVYRIVYVNRGEAKCVLAGIPGALGYATTGRLPVGPPATRTALQDRGGTIVLDQLHGQAETTFIIRLAVERSASCRPEAIDGVVIRPMGVPQMYVPLDNPIKSERQICRGVRNEAIYGFGPVTQPLL